MYNTQHLQEKWGPILDYDGVDPIKDAHRRATTAILLENQEKELREEASFLSEQPTVNTSTAQVVVQQVSLLTADCNWSCCWFRPST